MFFDRKIKYLDYVENGEKVRGAGFVKAEVRDRECRMMICVKGLHATDHFEKQVILLGDKQESFLCKIKIDGGRGTTGELRLDSGRLGRGEIPYEGLREIRIPIAAGKEIRCLWQEGQSGRRESEAVQRLPRERELQVINLRPERRRPEGESASEGADRGAGEQDAVKAASGQVSEGLSGERRAWKPTELGGVQDARRAEEPAGAYGAWKPGESGGEGEVRESEAPRGESGAPRAEEPAGAYGAWKPGGPGGEGEVRESEAPRGESGAPRAEEPAGAYGAWKPGGPGGEGEVREFEALGGERGTRETEAYQGVRSAGKREEPGGNAGAMHTGKKNRGGEQRERGPVKEDATELQGQEQRESESSRLFPLEDKWKQLSSIYPHITPFQDEREYLSLGPEDFVIFPNKFYRVVNNSFLLHGYHNYRHLILARMESRGEVRYYVGVPGNFYDKEKQVALMFGFESFECKQEPARSGDYGYYMMRVEL